MALDCSCQESDVGILRQILAGLNGNTSGRAMIWRSFGDYLKGFDRQSLRNK